MSRLNSLHYIDDDVLHLPNPAKKLKWSSDDESETQLPPSMTNSGAPCVSQDQPDQHPEPDFILRCFMEGAPGVGKSTLFNYFRQLASKMQPCKISSDVEPVVVGPIPFPMGYRTYYIAFEFFDQSRLDMALEFKDKHIPIYLACFDLSDIKTYFQVDKPRFQTPGQTVLMGLKSDIKLCDDTVIKASRTVADKIAKKGLTYIECSGGSPSISRIELILGYSFLFARGINVAIQGMKGVGKTSLASRLGVFVEDSNDKESDHPNTYRSHWTINSDRFSLPVEFRLWDMPQEDYPRQPDCVIYCVDFADQSCLLSGTPSAPPLLALLRADKYHQVHRRPNGIIYQYSPPRYQRYMQLSALYDDDVCDKVFATVIDFLSGPPEWLTPCY